MPDIGEKNSVLDLTGSGSRFLTFLGSESKNKVNKESFSKPSTGEFPVFTNPAAYFFLSGLRIIVPEELKYINHYPAVAELYPFYFHIIMFVTYYLLLDIQAI